MPAGKMHVDEVETNPALVRWLLMAQYPMWADLPVEPVPSSGTDNALYRLGNDMVVRLPRIHWAVGQVEKEHEWLPKLAPHLPLAIPEPLAMGTPAGGYPWEWSIHRWLDGESAILDLFADARQAAKELAQFITALQRIDPTGGPPAAEYKLRGVPLATQDVHVREAIAALDGMFNVDLMTAAWEAALREPDWDRPPVWFHGDMLPGNVLVDRGHLSAVIDFGGLGVGDPACDLMIAWSLFSGESRDVFRAAMTVDDATWARGRGCALCQALIYIPYYLETNPAGVETARRAVNEILADQS